ncbi:All-trans-retinol 13,14-reductase [Portunus trituberculatus]|uniref:All-trans-retinol 13,14-reductase n=1 Tax=Portunus trituberculatus TaxID=210409 RepID=A0A5B7FE56_PORTR|nr:All-trans-retinol 13,14-reductase [Portunus trituberculatus]
MVVELLDHSTGMTLFRAERSVTERSKGLGSTIWVVGGDWLPFSFTNIADTLCHGDKDLGEQSVGMEELHVDELTTNTCGNEEIAVKPLKSAPLPTETLAAGFPSNLAIRSLITAIMPLITMFRQSSWLSLAKRSVVSKIITDSSGQACGVEVKKGKEVVRVAAPIIISDAGKIMCWK